jgi:hypothetical protein
MDNLYNLYNLYNTSNFNQSFLQYKPIDQFPDNASQEHNDGDCIDGVHHLQVETGRPVWIFFSEKIHEQI